MNASDWWAEFSAGVVWAGDEYRSLGGFAGHAFTAKAEPVIARLGAIHGYNAINQGQRIVSGAHVLKSGREPVASFRAGKSAHAL